jgi:hypothetical protein
MIYVSFSGQILPSKSFLMASKSIFISSSSSFKFIREEKYFDLSMRDFSMSS